MLKGGSVDEAAGEQMTEKPEHSQQLKSIDIIVL